MLCVSCFTCFQYTQRFTGMQLPHVMRVICNGFQFLLPNDTFNKTQHIFFKLCAYRYDDLIYSLHPRGYVLLDGDSEDRHYHVNL
jgi:hypothetical protein